jgi:hypothetical protein
MGTAVARAVSSAGASLHWAGYWAPRICQLLENVESVPPGANELFFPLAGERGPVHNPNARGHWLVYG